MAKPGYQSPCLASVVLGPKSWRMGHDLSVLLPPDLQAQQSIVVGDSVLASWKEAGIDPDIILVPVESGDTVAVVSRGTQSFQTRNPASAMCCSPSGYNPGRTFTASLSCPHLEIGSTQGWPCTQGCLCRAAVPLRWGNTSLVLLTVDAQRSIPVWGSCQKHSQGTPGAKL